MTALLNVILPVFLVIGFGWIAARSGKFPETAVDGLMRFAQTFAIPCLLFSSIARLDLSSSFDLGLFASFYAGAFTGFGLGFLGGRLIFGRPLTDSIAFGFAAMFSNSLLLGLPITERAFGAAALDANYAIIAIHSPLLYAVGILAMELARSQGQGLGLPRLGLQVGRAILMQPLVIGILLGFIVNVTAMPVPGVVQSALDLMIRAALPAALFGLGGVLYRYRPEGDAKAIAWLTGLSLIVHPSVTYLLGSHVFGLTTGQLRSAVVTAAMAPGVNAYLFAHMYGVGKRVAASTVLVATGLTILTAWGWLHLLP